MDIDSGEATLGHPAFLVPQDVIVTVLDLTEEAWRRVLASGQVTRSSTEPDIAGQLYKHLTDLKRERKLALLIIEEVGTRTRGAKRPDGRIDIKTYDDRSFDERQYFGVECKRVSSTDQRLAGDYVSQGVARFTDGKYCYGLDYAGMFGFAIDANCLGCSTIIAQEIAAARSRVQLLGEWARAPAPFTREHLYHTTHQQNPDGRFISILHLFLAFN